MAANKTGKFAPHIPTEKQKGEVSALISFGNTQDDIALYLGISTDTLQKKYREELDNGALKANARVAGKLYKKAIDQEDITAIIFWLKTRARWREKDPKEDDTNINITINHENALKELK